MHPLISPRFLKSQPVPGHSTIGRELDRRLVQSQPATHSGSPRLVLKQLDYTVLKRPIAFLKYNVNVFTSQC